VRGECEGKEGERVVERGSVEEGDARWEMEAYTFPGYSS
jgi:hypothetical protein